MTTQKNKLRIGVVGATGVVGRSFLELLEAREFPMQELRAFASETSEGKKIQCQQTEWSLQVLKPGCFDGLDLVFFSSGDEISLNWAPEAEKAGAWAVDNSAAFRTNPAHHLVVPEVNADLLKNSESSKIIANPNCTTIQLVVALKPLQEQFGLNEVRIASYQAASGAGQPGCDELKRAVEMNVKDQAFQSQVFPHNLALNCIPEIGKFDENGYSSEEMKVIFETKKILRNPKLKVSAFTVRVPVQNAHAEVVWATLEKECSRADFVAALSQAPGIVVQDDPKKSLYPLQSKASGTDPVYVGRIHRDLDDPKTWLMWIVADNVRKGAALNGIQIAERIFDIPFRP